MSRFVLFIFRLNIDEFNLVLTVEAEFNLVNQVFSQTSSIHKALLRIQFILMRIRIRTGKKWIQIQIRIQVISLGFTKFF